MKTAQHQMDLTSTEMIQVDLPGQALIELPLLNKGTAFSEEERTNLGLLGFLPPHIESLDQQATRCYAAFARKPTDLDKHIYLRQLQDENEILFYRVMHDHIQEMMPLVYTPVVGEACQRFSEIYRRPRGLFISYPERHLISQIFANVKREVDVIVVTDGQRILGLGDQGVGGMGIPIGKLSLYSLCGGIHPARTLPILLDVGTNNKDRLNDPTYLGWRHQRVTGAEYEDFIEQFVEAVMERFPNVLLQWEDFASVNAEPILEKYRDRLCTFNDDIQGTAAVAAGTIQAGIAVAGDSLLDQRFVMLGAGSAGVGMTEQLIRTMVHGGMSDADARRRFFLIDIDGLIHNGRTNLDPIHQKLAQSVSDLTDWDCDFKKPVDFEQVVRNAKPTVLVGATGQSGAFSENIIREMAAHTKHPIIFPLSNPTSRVEATPENLIHWTEGRALVATGSPFDSVEYNGATFNIAQCNNSYIFPAMGLGILASGATRVTDEMFMVAATALMETSPALKDATASLLPELSDIRSVSRHIAVAVARQAQKDGVAPSTSADQLQQNIDRNMWVPVYPKIKHA